MSDNREVVQIVISKLKPAASRERFIELTKEMKQWFLTQDGFIAYEVYENKHNWADKIVYENNDAADRINHLFMKTKIAKEMLELVEPDFSGFIGTNVDV